MASVENKIIAEVAGAIVNFADGFLGGSINEVINDMSGNSAQLKELEKLLNEGIKLYNSLSLDELSKAEAVTALTEAMNHEPTFTVDISALTPGYVKSMVKQARDAHSMNILGARDALKEASRKALEQKSTVDEITARRDRMAEEVMKSGGRKVVDVLTKLDRPNGAITNTKEGE